MFGKDLLDKISNINSFTDAGRKELMGLGLQYKPLSGRNVIVQVNWARNWKLISIVDISSFFENKNVCVTSEDITKNLYIIDQRRH